MWRGLGGVKEGETVHDIFVLEKNLFSIITK